jgi:hypothetical protein
MFRCSLETSSLQLRAEFDNALNHTQFANPDTNFTSPTFAVITSASVNPRVRAVGTEVCVLVAYMAEF